MRLVPAAAVILALAAFGAPAVAAPSTGLREIKREHREVLRTLDPKHPGRGPDATHTRPLDEPAAYATILRAEGLRARVTGSRSARRRMRLCGRWLLRNRDRNRNGIVGWGLPTPYDAFGDGSIAPAHTEYTITTASATGALMDWLKLDRRAPRRRIVRAIRLAVEPYLASPPRGRTPSGGFAYSLSGADLRYDVYNVGAHTAAQFQRFSNLVRDRSLRRRLQSAADANMRILLRARLRSPAGRVYWLYGTEPPKPVNSLGHAGIIISAVRTYARAGGRLGRRFQQRRIAAHVLEFRSGGRWLRYPAFGRRRDPLPGTAGLTGLTNIAAKNRRLRFLLPIALRDIRATEFAPGRYATGVTADRRATIRGQAGVLSTFARRLWDRGPRFLLD